MNIILINLFIIILLNSINAQFKPETPKSPPDAKEIATPFKERNLCVMLSAGSSMPYGFWTCGVPFKQTYCGTETSFEYQCCPGFTKSNMVDNTCAEVKSVWKLLQDHLKDYAVPKLAALLSKADLPSLLNERSTKVYSIFVPYSDKATQLNEFNLLTAGGTPHPIRMHIAPNRIYSGDFTNGAAIDTVDNYFLKVTTYSNGLIFIDCRALVNPDHEARNGVIHYISGPILPHVGEGFQRKTVLQALQNEPQTMSFYNDIPSEMRTMLDQESRKEWYTIFAPKNEAWNEAKSKYSSKISLLVQNHIIKRMICAQAITRRTNSFGPTLANEYLGFDCSPDKSRVMLNACGNEVKIIKEDLVAGNGVVHVLDGVLVPTSVMEGLEAVGCISKSNPDVQISEFQQLISKCDLNLKSDGNYVLLIPENIAFKNLEADSNYKTEFGQLSSDNDYLCNTLRYHVLKISGIISPSWTNQMKFETNYEKDGSAMSVISTYVKYRDGSKLFFNGARTTQLEPQRFSQGYIYFVDKINVIPVKTIAELMSERTDIAKTYAKFQESGYGSQLSGLGHGVLFLACQNHGWSTRKEKKYGSDELSKLFQLHTIKLEIWGNEDGHIHRETYSTVNSVYEDGGKPFQLRIKRELNGNIYIGYDGLPFDLWSLVIDTALHGTDGTVWVVDWPLRFKE